MSIRINKGYGFTVDKKFVDVAAGEFDCWRINDENGLPHYFVGVLLASCMCNEALQLKNETPEELYKKYEIFLEAARSIASEPDDWVSEKQRLSWLDELNKKTPEMMVFLTS